MSSKEATWPKNKRKMPLPYLKCVFCETIELQIRPTLQLHAWSYSYIRGKEIIWPFLNFYYKVDPNVSSVVA